MGLINNLLHGKKIMNENASDSKLLIEVTESQKRLIKQNLMMLLKDVDTVCKKYQITYMLVYGSALGAIRHHGFIPWDDDLDISMPRKDYNKFVEVFNAELGDKYILNASTYSNKAKTRFPKILIKGTHFREVLDSQDKELQTLYMDIFILENIPDNTFVRITKGICCNVLEFITGQVLLYENRDTVVKSVYCMAGKSNYYARVIIGFVFSFFSSNNWSKLLDSIIQYDNENTKYCGLPTGRKHYFGDYFVRESVLPPSEALFEGMIVPVFNDPHKCLTELYGDYMKIPPENERERHFVREIDLG